MNARHAVEQLLIGGVVRLAAEQPTQRLRGRVAPFGDEALDRIQAQDVEARAGADEDERVHALGCAQGDVACDAPAHGKADEVELRCLEVRRDAQHVAGELLELQRAFVILRIAVAARIPGGGLEAAGEKLDLAGPVAAIAADAVQKKDELSRARDRDREPRRRIDKDRFQDLFRLGSRDSDRARATFAVLL